MSRYLLTWRGNGYWVCERTGLEFVFTGKWWRCFYPGTVGARGKARTLKALAKEFQAGEFNIMKLSGRQGIESLIPSMTEGAAKTRCLPVPTCEDCRQPSPRGLCRACEYDRLTRDEPVKVGVTGMRQGDMP